MSASDVAVIDYGLGNLLSVQRALEHCGAAVAVTSDPETISRAARVVLPGVGAFENGMSELRRHALDGVVREVARRGTPLLGICLGMQMLLDESEEFGLHAGLGLVSGRVTPVPATDAEGSPHKIPHIGWSALLPPEARETWRGTPLEGVSPGETVYFVHSYMAVPTDAGHRIADCSYGGKRVSAAIGKGNIWGCQFHPEKSGRVGLRILSQFLAM